MAAKLKLDLLVDDKGSAVVKKFGTGTDKAMRVANKAVIGFGAALAASTAVIGVAVSKSLAEFQGFETALTDMGKVIGPGQSLDTIRKEIMAIDPVLGSSTDLMRGYYQVVSAGITEPKEALDLLTAAAQAAAGAHVDQETAINALTKLMSGFSGQTTTLSDGTEVLAKNFTDAKDAADLLFRIEKDGQTTVADLVPIIGDLAGISADAGLSAEDMAGSLATLTLRAGSTSMASTQLTGIISAMIKPTSEMKAAISAMGFESGDAAIKSLGFSTVLKKLKDSTGGSSTKLGELFGRLEGLKGIMSLASGDFKNMDARIISMGERAGGTEKAFKDWSETFAAVKETFDNTISNVAIKLGSEIVPLIQSAMKDIASAIDGAQDELILLAQGLATAGEFMVWAAGVTADWSKRLGLLSSGWGSWKDIIALTHEELANVFTPDHEAALKRWKTQLSVVTKEMTAVEKAMRKAQEANDYKNIEKSTLQYNKLSKEQDILKGKIRTAEFAMRDFGKQSKKSGDESVLASKGVIAQLQNVVDAQTELTDKQKKELAKRLKAERKHIDSLQGLADDEVAAYDAMNAAILADIDVRDAEKLAKEKARIEELKLLNDDEIAAYAGMEQAILDAYIIHEDKLLKENEGTLDLIKKGLEESVKEGGPWPTWSEGVVSISRTMGNAAEAAISQSLFAALKGDMDTFETTWQTFVDALLKSFTDVVAEMVVTSLVTKAVDILALVPAFAEGAWKVKQDQVAIVHQGEMILPADVAEAVRTGFGGEAMAPDLSGQTASPEAAAAFGQVSGKSLALSTMGAVASGTFGLPVLAAAFIKAFMGGTMAASATTSFADPLATGIISSIATIGASIALGPVGGFFAALLSSVFSAPLAASLGFTVPGTEAAFDLAQGTIPGSGAPLGNGFGFGDSDSGVLGAPYHTGGMIGMKTDERLIVGQTGEGVLSRRGMTALDQLNRGGLPGSAPIYITVEIGGQEFDARIKSISDGVRVKAAKRNMGTKRIYA